MGIVIQIGLTLWAWNRGWKAWALLPVGIPFVAGLVWGVYTGINGATVANMESVLILMDLSSMVILVGMIGKGRNPVMASSTAVENGAVSPMAHDTVEARIQ